MVAYGAYVPRAISIAKTGIVIAFADTVVALMAGLAIFPLVFEYELTPSEGPGLIFVTLPIAFGEMPLGAFFGTLFFVMLFLAAFTSAISLLEPSVALLMERFSLTRLRAVTITGAALWACSMPSIFSFNRWSGVHPVKYGVFEEKTLFDLLDYLTANILLPIGGFLTAVFVAWVLTKHATSEELGLGDRPAYRAWRITLRFIAPIAIVVIFLNAIGVLDPVLQALGLSSAEPN
jgi:NSS family neurotransmitter:Na+ symporter